MLGRLLGTTATTILARQIGGTAVGPAGAMLGLALPFVARRFGPFGMVGMAVGAWAINRILNDRTKDAAADAVINVRAE